MSEFRVIDERPLLQDPISAAPAVRSACLDEGFFFIRAQPNARLIPSAFEKWQAFAALPGEKKQPYHRSVACEGRHGGWHNLREEPVYMSHMDDSERTTDNPKQQFGCSVRTEQTIWPVDDLCDGFSASIKRCALWLDAISRRLFEAFDAVLEQPAGFLRYAPGYLTFSVYPAQAPERSSTVGLQEHSDSDIFTILTQQTEGLQVLDRNQVWRTVPRPQGDDLFVIAGDWMELWTNGAIPAVRHRVLDVATSRVSLAFFQNVGSMQIGPLPAFVSEQSPARYPTVASDIEYADGETGVPRWRTAVR